MEYIRSLLPSLLELFGADEARALAGRAARLIGLQYYDEIAALLGIRGDGAEDFAALLGALAAAQGEDVEVEGATVTQRGWRLMYNVSEADAMFGAWNALWEGALAVHNRDLELVTERQGGTIVWRIG